jgi:very-short-patch-repair endonuclease
MGITMNEITERLHNKAMAIFMPVIEQMAKEGCDKNQIVGAYQNYIKGKSIQFYQRQKDPRPIKKCFNLADLQKADSKIEMIFFEMLKSSGIKFTFQHVIGPYRADYLVMGFLVVEIDGPQHDKKRDDKRDKYLKKMGYEVFRIPTWVLVSCPEAAIQEIHEAVKNKKV